MAIVGQAAISSHGVIIEHAPGPPGDGIYVELGEVGDLTLPGMMRNEFDATPHGRNIDSFVMGVLRREPITFPLFFNKGEDSHAALRSSIIANSYDGFRITFPDGDLWIGSGFVKQVSQSNPVDGIQTANVTLRLSGPMMLNGTLIGD